MDRTPSRILLVEDEPAICDLLVELLNDDELQIRAVSDGDAALAVIDEFDPALVLLDIALPGRSGFDVLTHIRAQRSPAELPVIMLTGLDARESVVRALELGASDYVAKPLDISVVRARIRTQLSLRDAVRQGRRLERALARRNLELEGANRDLAKRNGQMRADLESAARLQRALLPDILPAVEGIDFAWTFRPCEELAGDILNVFELGEHHIGLYLLDVSGHGVKAALLSVTLSRILAPLPDQPSLVRRRREGVGPFEPTPPHVVAEELNRRFPFDEKQEQYFSLFYGVLDLRTNILRYVSAGQPGPIHAPAYGPPRSLHEPIFAIGWVPQPGYQSREIELSPGDRLYLFTDGLPDARREGEGIFGEPRIARVVSESRGQPLDEAVAGLVDAVQRWSGGPFEDDVSVLAVAARGR